MRLALYSIILTLLISTVVLAAGGKNRGDDPYDAPGSNPVVDSEGNLVGEVIPLQCDRLVKVGKSDWLCIYED